MSASNMNRKNRRRRTGIEKLLRASLLAAGGWILYSKLSINHELPLPEAITATRKDFLSEKAGKLSYYIGQTAIGQTAIGQTAIGRPLVLIHSVNAAASAFEMRPLFEHYRANRPVFALDLPGYGFSERSQRVYTPEMFENAVLDFMEQEVKEPADVVALSLGCEFAARAAARRPELFHSLAFISPTGLSAGQNSSRSQQAREKGSSNALFAAFSFPLWSRPFFDLLATRASINYFLGKSFTGPVPEALAQYAYQTAHQPGAEYVPLYFISGKLFSAQVVERFYETLQTPVLVIYDHDPFTGFDLLPDLLAKNSNWRAVRIIPSMGLPHWEQLPQTSAALDQFWAGLE